MGSDHVIVELRQVMAGVTVTGSIAISPEAFARVPEVSAARVPDGSTPAATHQAVSLRLRSALLQWLSEGHQAAVQSLDSVACDLLKAELQALRGPAASIERGAA